uniref:Glycerol-3-phosphate dehydrogenase n=1 Tax=Chlamydomonas euryale TaxID=1486919 RepID=A0A7R9V8C5_9CHLO
MLRRLATTAFYAGAGGTAVVAVTTVTGLWGSGKVADAPFLSDTVPTRAQQLSKLLAGSREKPFDLLVIGGGATGAGCAVDAATRGLNTVLIEREDFGSGTSSKSTKLVHGGVRYLEKAVFQADPSQLKLVFEALHERANFLANVPHLAHPLPIMTPCYQWWEVPYYWAGLKAYDAVAGTTNLVMSKYLNRVETMNFMPTLAEKNPETHAGLKGSILYYDGQFDDSRMCVTLATSAASAGAITLNHAECAELIKNEEGKVIGAKMKDNLTGKTHEVYAKVLLNATGVFTDGVRKQSDNAARTTVMGSSGVHVTLPAFYGSATMGMLVPKTKDGRVLFLLPWQGALIAGTTDTKCLAEAKPAPSEADVAWVLDTLSDHLGVKVRREDVLSAWSGIRPLPAPPPSKGGGDNTQNVVRDHVMWTDADGMLNMTGGKWTTYRKMAEEAVDAVVATGRVPSNTGHCVTGRLPLRGARTFRPTLAAELGQQLKTDPLPGLGAAHDDVAAHLASSYGDRAPEVLRIAREKSLGNRLAPGLPVLEAEVAYCAAMEYSETPDDFLERRVRMAFMDASAAIAALPRVAELMGNVHGWSRERRAKEIDNARALLTRQYVPAVEAAAA